MTNRLLRAYSAIHQAVPCLLVALFLLSVGPALQAQGEIGGVRVLRPVVGAGLVTEAVEFSFGAAVVDPGLRLRFGFGTDEGLGPGGFGDSFTLTLQDDGGTLTLVLVTVDAGGPVWAPPTPGTTPVAPESLAWSAIAYPSLTPVVANRWAYELAVALPQSAVGRPLTLYFDLFNNQDGLASQGWFGEVVLVPEPGVWALALLGALMLWWQRRRSPATLHPALNSVLNLPPAHQSNHEGSKLRSRIKIKRRSGVCVLLLSLGLLLGPGQLRVQAQTEAEFTLNNVTVTLAEVTPEADVYFRSLRLNRALNVWNVEVSVSNKVDRVLAGPVVLLIDGFSGTTGLQAPDGTTTDGDGFLDLSAEAGDGALSPGEVSAPRTLTLGRSGTGSPTLTTKVFAARPPVAAALGVTRSLDEAGRPLPGVALAISGPVGSGTQTSDAPSGVASFGQGPGEHLLKFSTEGYLPVWRKQTLVAERTTVLPNPRLTKRSPNTFAVTPLGGTTVSNAPGTIAITFAAGAVSQSTTVTLTPLTGQNLPAFLPAGWSPMNAFWLESSSPVTGKANAALRPAGAINGTETAALVRWNETGLQWLVVQTLGGQGTNAVNALLPGPGAYALVVGDTGPQAPPAAQLGQALAGSSVGAIDPAGLSATGNVTPPASPASVIPEFVTGTANLVVTHAANNLPSGYLLRGEVTETYLLGDGSLRLTPQYEHFIVGYQRPGDADPRTLHASFPMRPVLLFGTDQLEEATVRVDVLPEQPFDGQVLDAGGGQIGAEGVRLLAGSGRLTGPSALRLRRLDATVFTNLVSAGQEVVAAFDLTVDGSTLTGTLGAQLTGAPADGLFVIARVLSEVGFYGLQPVERLQSDAQGNLSSLEPITGERLPGLRGSGQFVLVRVGAAQGLISGVARNGQGEVQSNMPVRLTGLPWLTLTDTQGRFQLVAPVGAVEMGATDPLTGDTGFVSVTIPDPQTAVEQDLGTAPAGPRVAQITPADNATRVPRVGSVVLRFNEAVNPATVIGGAIQLLKPDDSIVTAALTLNLRNTIATLSPAVELEANTTYRVRLAATIADPGGLPLEGQSEFSFTTVPLSTRVATAQLIIYEPGATNVPSAILDDIPAFEPGDDPFAIVVHGQPGVADPEVPVILVNESTGETQTVLSKVDGSFSSFISGTEEDFVSATFVNLNGTRVYVPVSRQEFDDGFVGLYPQGGILEAQSDGGPVRVLIEPSAIPTRSKFKLEPLNIAKLTTLLGGVMPEDGQIAGQALNLRIEGPAPTLPMEVRFPVNLTALGYPTNEAPRDVAAMLAVVRDTDGVKTFEVMDQLLFTPDESAAGALRLQGEPRLNNGDLEQIASGFLNTSVGLVIPALGPTVGGAVQIGFNQVLVPLLFGPRPVVIKGKVAGLPMELAVGLERAGILNQILNAQTGLKSVDVPYQIAQQMGLANPLQVFGGLAQQLIGVGVQAFEQQMLVLSKPLPGAFVSLRLSHGPIKPIRGRLFPGMVYATSGQDGYFLTVAPAAGAQYLINATHPLYDQVLQEPANPLNFIPGQQGDLTLSGVVFKNFYFFRPNDTDLAPNVSIANTPVRPAAGQETKFVVDASLATGTPRIAVAVSLVGTTNLLTGLHVENPVAVLTEQANVSGGNRAQWTGTLTADEPILVELKVIIDGPNGEQDAIIPFPIGFTGPIPTLPHGDLPKPDTNDVHGPLVVETRPGDNSYLGDDGEITIFFNKPIDGLVTNNLAGVQLSQDGDGGAVNVKPVVRLEAGQQVLTLRYPGLARGASYRLTLSGQSIRDLAEQPLDQDPSTPEPNSFARTFRTPKTAEAELPELTSGRGATISGERLYVLEQGQQGSQLLTYDISSPLEPKKIGAGLRLRGTARDLVVVPQFGYKLNATSPVEISDIIAVVGGDLDTLINTNQGTTVSVPGQYLWLISMANPEQPKVLASTLLSLRVASAVTEIRWAPPNLVYLEFGADIQLIGFVNLQAMLFGFNSPANRTANFGAGRAGEDLNGDGDYVDEGETLPIPPSDPPEFFGKGQNLVLQNTTQKILDFAVEAGGGIVGVTLRNGIAHDSSGRPLGAALPMMYRTFVYNGLPLDISNPAAAMYPFKAGAYPRWVSILPAQQLLINDTITTRSLALVSLSPGTNGLPALAVIDISLPMQPELLHEIPLSEELLGGTVGGIVKRADGLLELTGSRNKLLLEPRYLAVTNYPPDQLPPAIAGVVDAAGTALRTFATTDHGVNAVAEGGRNAVVLSAPRLRFVSFPNAPSLLDPKVLRLRQNGELDQLFNGLNPLHGLAPANARTNLTVRSDLNPPTPALHYHVLMIAPGGAGPEVELGLEALNPAGRPLPNLGLDFAPVRSVSGPVQQALNQAPRPGCGAPISPLKAYRVSDDPYSPYYNWYLSQPFAVITAGASIAELEQWKTSAGVERQILFSAAAMRAFIDPGQDKNPVIGPFAGEVDPRRQQIFPPAQALADAVNRSYLTGDNPPPHSGATPIEDTYGTVQSHSGEVRTTDVDLSLPSPLMPINIIRAIGNQDNFEGPFGVGWDFNYNERLTVLDPLTFPQGLRMPLVVRGTEEQSDIAGSRDVLYSTGQGFDYQFVWKGTNMPPEFAADPLVDEFDYATVVSDYYLPRRGLFDLLVRFKDGRFERLTSDGVRHRYSPQGRLEAIIDRYPKNRHNLTYDANGWLRRIDDRSVSGPRFVEFGHFRRQSSDPEFISGLDEPTRNPYLEGKICRLRDYAGRDVLFFYDDEGFLIRREGVEVSGENGGFSGRNKTFYTYTDCRLVGISARAEGTPLVSANIVPGNRGKAVAQSIGGSVANHQLDIPLNNSAATLGSQSSGVTLGDGARITRTYDAFGNIASESVSTAGQTATQEFTHSEDGLETYVKYPEGNSITRVYDSSNPVFRSRGNLLSVTVDPGQRGGSGYTETYRYDPRYNQAAGPQVNANGFTTTIELTGDGRAARTINYEGEGGKTASYNENGQTTGTTDPNGIERTLVYNASTGFLEQDTYGGITYRHQYGGGTPSLLGKPSAITPPLGLPTRFNYDALLQTLEVARGDLISISAYDELGRLGFQQTDVGDGKRKTIVREYNDKNFMTRITTSGVEIEGVEGSYSHQFVPDSRSRIKEAHLPNGTVRQFEYDGRGNLVRVTLGDYVEEYGYDLNNNRTTVMKGGELVQTIEYDGLNRATNVISHTGGGDYSVVSGYYPGGELQTQQIFDPVYGLQKDTTYDRVDSLGRHRSITMRGNVISPTYTYDHGQNFSGITGPRLASTTRWDAAGNQTGYTDPNLQLTIVRDSNGRVETIQREEDGGTFAQNFGYNNVDQQTSLGDLLGTKYNYEPRADGLYRQVTNARGNRTTMEHSSLGEKLRQLRPDGMEVVTRHNSERQMTYVGDPQAGFDHEYDGNLRLTTRGLRNGSFMTFEDFDGRNLPTRLTFPGGESTQSYDLQGRMVQRSVVYQGTTWEETLSYDALNRVRRHLYRQTGGAENEMTREYDPAGPLLGIRSLEDGAEFNVAFGYYADGTRRSVTYPSGVVVTEERDNTGRLTGLSDADGNIIRAVSWQGNDHPKVVELGGSMDLVNSFDARGRLTGSRVTRTGDGALLAHLRYQYDGVNNVEVRQFLHRGGLADNLVYDAGERLDQALLGARPMEPAGFSAGNYGRDYEYDSQGLDLLVGTITTNLLETVPAFAASWSGHDGFLLPAQVDGVNRQSDPLGRVAEALFWSRDGNTLQQRVAAIQHDGLGHLVSVMRDDGLEAEYRYQPGGLRHAKLLRRNGQVIFHRAFVYDDSGRLLEEYDRLGAGPLLVARYFYASGDAPVAADLPHPQSGQLSRYFYLRDVSQSVIAVADAAGVVQERTWYDPHGQPVIEQRDDRAPELLEVRSNQNGDALLIALSEPVWIAQDDPGPGGGIVRQAMPDWSGILNVSVGSTNIAGSVSLLTTLPGYAPYSVFEFRPDEALPEPPSALEGWWPADQAVIDVVAGNHGALAGGAAVGPGLIGQAFQFNGSSAYVEVPDANALDFAAGDFTAALWVRFNSTVGEQVLIEKWNSAPAAGWSLVKLADNRLRVVLADGAGGSATVDSGVLGLANQTWLQVAFRREGGQVTVLTNGVAVATGSGGLNVDNASSLKFGTRQGNSSFLRGSLDEVTVYSRALSDAELRLVAGGVIVPGIVTVQLNPDTLADEWGNRNETTSVTFAAAGEPDVTYYRAVLEPATAAVVLSSSGIGSPFLFHGQYFDEETGLLYLRARYYDPYSGMFLEPDPLGYEDSVNHYAGMANNPASLRDPSGLLSRGVSRFQYYSHLRKNGFSFRELFLVHNVHSRLTKQGLGDIEIAAHVRVMYQAFKRGVNYEMSIRKANNPNARMNRTEEGHQGKIEKIVAKSDKETALVEHEGQQYTGDLDGLYLLRNGQPATLAQTESFQNKVNGEMARLAPGFREMAARGGQEYHADVVQKAYHHGVSLNLPQEYGTLNDSMPGATHMGIAVWDNIELKMKKGTGEAFAFGLNKSGGGFNFKDNVDVNAAIKLYENFYSNVLFNPAAKGNGYDPVATARYQAQMQRDGGRQPLYWFPTTFYGHNYGGVQ